MIHHSWKNVQLRMNTLQITAWKSQLGSNVYWQMSIAIMHAMQ
jgi:hypothetical protein